MNLFKLVDVIDKKMASILVEPNICTSIISPLSSCTRCVDHCPTNSITLTKDKLEVDDQCVACGLCSTVCPTNALASQRPSLNQLVTDLLHTCEQNERVYLHCERLPIQERNATAVSVPCLAALPKEAWVTMIGECENLAIYHPDGGCNNCEISKGEEVWRKELLAGETICGKRMMMTSLVQQSKQQPQFDTSKRAFFSSLFSEMKATNKFAIREVLGSTQAQTVQQKLRKDPISVVKKEWTEVSNSMIEKMTHESSHPYMNKRNLFLDQMKKHEPLQKQKDIRLPVILPECNFCGACSILCPTNALSQETKDGITSIVLHPNKCVDCRLCEDICYFKGIRLQNEANKNLLSKTKLLGKKYE